MIEAQGLAKSFTTRGGTVEAVRGVDLDVAAGELVGFLGPNGAGKTTTQRMLTTLLGPTAGTASAAGHDIAREAVAVRQRIGYVLQGGTEPEARVGEELVDHGRLDGFAPGWLGTLADANPVKHVIDALRSLFLGHLATAAVAWGLVAALALLAAGIGFATRTFQRESS